MNHVIQHLVFAAALLATTTTMAEPLPANHNHHSAQGNDAPSSRAFMAANATMHHGMDIAFTGDADIDFLRGMIAHHQGAVDMATIQLQYGENAQVKKLSREIIRAQKLEIAWMQHWLAQLEGRPHRPRTGTWIGEDSPLYK